MAGAAVSKIIRGGLLLDIPAHTAVPADVLINHLVGG
jgi:hypothetical protein